MRDLVLEIVVTVALALIGITVAAIFTGNRAWKLDLDVAYIIGAVTVSIPAILIYERRRRRGF